MTVTLSAENRPIRATTPLGKELVAVSFTGEEALSQPYLFTVDFLSTNSDVTPASMLGKPVTLEVLATDGGTVRIVHGLVRRFISLGHDRELSHYRAELVPGLWFLTLSSDCRTFENLSAEAIVTNVCKAAGVTDVKTKVTGARPTMPFVVQYRETNFDFVSRLLEEAGLYYTFEHSESGHTLVISDAVAGSIPTAPTPAVKLDTQKGTDGWPPNAVIRIEQDYLVHSAGVQLSNHGLLANDASVTAASQDVGTRGQRFDFMGTLPASLDDDAARRLIEIEEGLSSVVRGASNATGLQAGTRTKLVGGEFGAGGTEFHLVSVRHRLEGGDALAGQGMDATYENEFVGIPAATRFRPPMLTRRPQILGTHAAKVVGAGGTGEIDVDADGRILLHFPWDRGDIAEGQSKFRVHVASVWAGAGWGAVQIPRVGQEVLVEFLDGDVNRPIVTGRVYNHVHKTPYELPANKTQAGLMSRTLGGGSDNFNELRFEDKKGEEHVYAQAEKDLKVLVKNDETRDVQHDRTTTIKNNDTRTVSEGNDKHTVSLGDQTIEISAGKQETTVAKGDQIVTVTQGKQTITVHDDQTLTVEQGARLASIKTGNDTLEVDTGNLTMTVKTGDVSMKASAGNITVEAMQKLTLKVGQNSIVISQEGIEIKALKVSVEATTQAELKGAMVTVQAQSMMQVKGAMTQVNADAMLTLKGAITMIN